MLIITPLDAFNICQSNTFSLEKLKGLMVTPNFSWREVFARQSVSDIKCADLFIFTNALATAKKMQQIRTLISAHLGPYTAIDVTNWYRSPAYNLKVKGAKASSHLVGNAVDFTVRGLESVKGCQLTQALILPHKDIIGFCVEITNGGWTHIDTRQSHIVFENAPGYPVWSLAKIQAFIKAHRP